MKKWVKIILCIFIAGLIIAGGIVGGLKIMEYTEEQKMEMEKAQAEAAEKERIARAYQKINYAIFMAANDDEDLHRRGMYLSFPDPRPDKNPYGVDIDIYLALKKYEKSTKNTLKYEALRDYVSQEYEPDGTLRLYNNGRHPEVEGYVEWMWEHKKEAENYARELETLYFRYWREHRDEMGANDLRVFYSISPQMYDELAKKEADPNYEMDLVSLQEQGL
jgi:hypothetical protein